MPRAIRILAAVLALVVAGGAAHAESTKGRLLVAAESMPDPRFAESVIYMVDHDAEGAFGLIVNKPLAEMPLAEFLDAAGIAADRPEGRLRVHFGGPVQPEAGFLLHPTGYARANTVTVDGGYAMTAGNAALTDFAKGGGPERYVFALGYAGWGPGQLDTEIARDDWYVIPADEALVFTEAPETSWDRALARRGIDL